MSELRVLVIDTDRQRCESLRVVLEFMECRVLFAGQGDWSEVLAGGGVELVLLGMCEDGESMLGVYRSLKEADVHLPIVVVGGGEGEVWRELEVGAVARVGLPVRHAELQHALQQVSIYRENRHLAGGPRSLELFRNLVGGSSAIRRVRRLIEQVADTDASVLLLGESGTGKEVVARNVHYYSSRRYKPFVPVNCGAIPADLLESELFGHEKGAFTGAISARRGRFEMAEGGTLFLDEIGDMSLAMQVKLLRVLQERTFERVGSNKSLLANVRIIAATHTDLEDAITEGKFREDLYYRLNVFPIEMPPLRGRVEDLALLINDLVSRMEHENRGSIRLGSQALQALQAYSWPGNVRELANLIERLVILYPYGVVDVQDLPEKYRGGAPLAQVLPGEELGVSAAAMAMPVLPPEGLDLKEHLARLEYSLIKQALDESAGVVAHAAKRLRLGRTTLVEKMRKYGLQRAEEVSNL